MPELCGYTEWDGHLVCVRDVHDDPQHRLYWKAGLVVADPVEPPKPNEKVVDLMAALEESVAAAKEARARHPQPGSAVPSPPSTDPPSDEHMGDEHMGDGRDDIGRWCCTCGDKFPSRAARQAHIDNPPSDERPTIYVNGEPHPWPDAESADPPSDERPTDDEPFPADLAAKLLRDEYPDQMAAASCTGCTPEAPCGAHRLLARYEALYAQLVETNRRNRERRAVPSLPVPDPQPERLENCSVEVIRWGPAVWLAIRSEQSVGKAIELTLPEARDLAAELTRAASSTKRRIRDEPRA